MRLDKWAEGLLSTNTILLDNQNVDLILGVTEIVNHQGHKIEAGVLGLAGPGIKVGPDGRGAQSFNGFFP
jgi:hypothetical protein